MVPPRDATGRHGTPLPTLRWFSTEMENDQYRAEKAKEWKITNNDGSLVVL